MIFTKELVYTVSAKFDQHPRNIAPSLFRDMRDGITKNFSEVVPGFDILVKAFMALSKDEQDAEKRAVDLELDRRTDETSEDWRMRSTKDFNDWRLEKGFWTPEQYNEWVLAVQKNREARR